MAADIRRGGGMHPGSETRVSGSPAGGSAARALRRRGGAARRGGGCTGVESHHGHEQHTVAVRACVHSRFVWRSARSRPAAPRFNAGKVRTPVEVVQRFLKPFVLPFQRGRQVVVRNRLVLLEGVDAIHLAGAPLPSAAAAGKPLPHRARGGGSGSERWSAHTIAKGPLLYGPLLCMSWTGILPPASRSSPAPRAWQPTSMR